ncbi:hypothetical protein T439DRAFT_379131 [Meredithblackwellia eburnea MCA 4105]
MSLSLSRTTSNQSGKSTSTLLSPGRLERKPATIDTLPDEILIKIAGNLKVEDARRLRLSNCRWCTLATPAAFAFANFGTPSDPLQVRAKRLRFYMQAGRGNYLKKLVFPLPPHESIEALGDLTLEYLDRFPNLQELDVRSDHNEPTKRLGSLFSELKRLKTFKSFNLILNRETVKALVENPTLKMLAFSTRRSWTESNGIPSFKEWITPGKLPEFKCRLASLVVQSQSLDDEWTAQACLSLASLFSASLRTLDLAWLEGRTHGNPIEFLEFYPPFKALRLLRFRNVNIFDGPHNNVSRNYIAYVCTELSHNSPSLNSLSLMVGSCDGQEVSSAMRRISQGSCGKKFVALELQLPGEVPHHYLTLDTYRILVDWIQPTTFCNLQFLKLKGWLPRTYNSQFFDADSSKQYIRREMPLLSSLQLAFEPCELLEFSFFDCNDRFQCGFRRRSTDDQFRWVTHSPAHEFSVFNA